MHECREPGHESPKPNFDGPRLESWDPGTGAPSMAIGIGVSGSALASMDPGPSAGFLGTSVEVPSMDIRVLACVYGPGLALGEPR